jgi:hypothetical protein
MRASTSLGPPGVNATTRVTGRVGYSAAILVDAMKMDAAMLAATAISLRTQFPP